MSVVTTWMKLEGIVLNKMSRQKEKHCIVSLIEEEVKSHSHMTLCNPMDSSPPSSSVHGILQARILDLVVISFFRGCSQSRDQTESPTLQADSLPSEPPEKIYFTQRYDFNTES